MSKGKAIPQEEEVIEKASFRILGDDIPKARLYGEKPAYMMWWWSGQMLLGEGNPTYIQALTHESDNQKLELYLKAICNLHGSCRSNLNGLNNLDQLQLIITFQGQ